jgi:putative heme transporter
MATVLRRFTAAAASVPARVLHVGIALAVLAVVGCAFWRSRSLPPLGRLTSPDPRWLLLAVVAQAASLTAYALIVRELLGIGNVAARTSTLLRATVGGIAMGASLPGGQIASAAFWYKQLRQEGADRSLSAFALVASMLAGVFSLAALLVVGLAATGGEGPLAAARLPILAACGALVLFAIPFHGRAARAIGRLSSRFARLPDGYSQDRRSLAAIALLAVANWLLDCLCLYAALAAVHASVPLRSILLVYTLAQLVAALPLLPGGGGTVEASLLLGFAAFSPGTGSLFAGVLLYRLLSCWGLIPIGWLAVLGDARRLIRPRARVTAALHARPAAY